MFVGASPGGTGGGIKTTTAAVLFGAIPALARRKPAIVFFGRTVSLESFYRSAAITAIGLGIIIMGGVLLLATQTQSFESLLFELFSAFGTVGLSLGATAQLDVFGKVVIVLVMFAGRVGPLALALLLGRTSAANLEYPEVKIMVG